jgi:hypothetical protein
MIIEIKVGANSRIIDCLAAKAIKVFGIKGLLRFKAVCIATTPPIKKEIKATIPKEPIISSFISLKISSFNTDRLVILPNTPLIIKKYSPIEWR